MRQRVVLGVSAFNHDASACIIAGGQLVSFGQEERYNRRKHSGEFPIQAIRWCLRAAGLHTSDITDVGFYFDPNACVMAYLRNNGPAALLRHPSVFRRRRFYHELLWLLQFRSQFNSIPRLLGHQHLRVHAVNHHLAHAFYGYFAAGIPECIVLCNDSVGESISSSAVRFQRCDSGRVRIRTILAQHDPHSLGYLYGAVTEYLGYRRGDGEGTVMALASYGAPAHIRDFDEGVTLLPGGRFRLSTSLLLPRSFQPRGQRLSPCFLERFGPPRSAEDEVRQQDADIAYALQWTTEKVLCHQVNSFDDAVPLVLTGGVALNSVANGRLADLFPYRRFFIPPIPDDAGTSIGAALFVLHAGGHHLPAPVETAFLGERFDPATVVEVLQRGKLHYREFERPIEPLVNALSGGEVVAIFRGPLECGPRALGHRSILADPTPPGMRDHLNRHVKLRESFRPYGGTIRRPHVCEVFDYRNYHLEAPYMSVVSRVRESWIGRIPSLVHTDGSCRIQILDDDDDPFFAKLLDAFWRTTGVPILINTSLNVKGQPIARTPQDALATFVTTAIDHLLLADRYLVSK